jgi:hypothetical protein
MWQCHPYSWSTFFGSYLNPCCNKLVPITSAEPLYQLEPGGDVQSFFLFVLLSMMEDTRLSLLPIS